MKSLALRSSRGSTTTAGKQKETPGGAVLGSIPGLERLLPGHYRPGDMVRSRYGTWMLPRSFKGHPLHAIIDGIMIG